MILFYAFLAYAMACAVYATTAGLKGQKVSSNSGVSALAVGSAVLLMAAGILYAELHFEYAIVVIVFWLIYTGTLIHSIKKLGENDAFKNSRGNIIYGPCHIIRFRQSQGVIYKNVISTFEHALYCSGNTIYITFQYHVSGFQLLRTQNKIDFDWKQTVQSEFFEFANNYINQHAGSFSFTKSAANLQSFFSNLCLAHQSSVQSVVKVTVLGIFQSSPLK